MEEQPSAPHGRSDLAPEGACQDCGAPRRDVAYSHRLGRRVCGPCFGGSFTAAEKAEVSDVFARQDLARDIRAAARQLRGQRVGRALSALAADTALGIGPVEELLSEAQRLGLEVTS